MDTAFEVLAIVLSSLFIILLVVSIVAAALALKIVLTVRRVVAKGEQVIDSAEAAAEIFKNAAGPLGAIKTILNVIETVAKHKSRKG